MPLVFIVEYTRSSDVVLVTVVVVVVANSPGVRAFEVKSVFNKVPWTVVFVVLIYKIKYNKLNKMFKT